MRRLATLVILATLLTLACRLPLPFARTAAPTPTSPALPTESPHRRCGDGVCDGPENPRNCPADCPPPAAPPTPTPEPGGPLPDVLAEIPLAPPDESVDDLLLDRAAHRLYATDSAGQLHVLDTAALAELATLSAAGRLTLDAAHHRLYASPTDDPGEVTVVDTEALAVVGTVSPGGRVAVDSTRHRLYVGNHFYYNTPEDAPGVRVYDEATLEKLGEVPQPGIPAYNPLRDELYVVAYTVYAVNPATLDITGDLLPELTDQPFLWCNGCPMATNARVFPDHNLLMVEMTELSAGKGPGTYPAPRFFDATTLTELTDLAARPPVERGCQRRITLAEPVDGRVYREQTYSRYVAFSNLLVYDTAGTLVDWRDGLFLGMTNPNTQQMYIAYPLDILVLDLPTLTPLGRLPPVSCLHTLDAEAGRIYAIRDDALLVLSQSGGEPAPSPSTAVDARPTVTIESIHPSPDYAHDRTLFLYQANRFYRSRDGGQTWAWLRGGLPETDHWFTLGLAISPDFARDRTLFAYGYRAEQWGEGVLRSTDGGDTWQPMWNGLTHLRVYDVALSPDYASDGTLLAFARYQRLGPWEAGQSIFRSTDGGLSWTLAITREQGSSLPSAADLLPSGPEPETRFRQNYAGGESAVQRTDDGGQTWETVFVMPPAEQYTSIEAVAPSPNFAADRTVYALHNYGLFRSTDGGETWHDWADERLAGRDYSNELTAMALSPPLDDGRHRLFIGTAAGELWALDPDEMVWEPLLAPSPSPPPSPTATPIAATPTPTPVARVPVAAPYAAVWERLGGAGGPLGNPLAPAVEGDYALQPFERGLMHWGWREGDTPYIHVLLYGPDGDPRRGDEWYRYEDAWHDGSDEYACPEAVPPLGPRRGFGDVWCACAECRAALGQPLEQEQGWTGGYQTFEGGIMLWHPAGDAVYVLFNRGDWQSAQTSEVSETSEVWLRRVCHPT